MTQLTADLQEAAGNLFTCHFTFDTMVQARNGAADFSTEDTHVPWRTLGVLFVDAVDMWKRARGFERGIGHDEWSSKAIAKEFVSHVQLLVVVLESLYRSYYPLSAIRSKVLTHLDVLYRFAPSPTFELVEKLRIAGVIGLDLLSHAMIERDRNKRLQMANAFHEFVAAIGKQADETFGFAAEGVEAALAAYAPAMAQLPNYFSEGWQQSRLAQVGSVSRPSATETMVANALLGAQDNPRRRMSGFSPEQAAAVVAAAEAVVEPARFSPEQSGM